jgi:nucleoside-diphosphate-sugar epimerase
MSTTAIATTEELEAFLSEPEAALVETMRALEGDIIVLGVGGKMGPTLARMARRASDAAGRGRRVIGVARFSYSGEREKLEAHGIETIACDLLDEVAVERLPDAENVVYMAGMKFGASENASLTWAMNAWLPGMVCRRFAGARIAAFSTGNVYGLTPVTRGGSLETDAVAPAGEYAMSCLGRERMLEYFSRRDGTRVALIRLNYACELRYGVLVDIAQRVWSGEAIDLTMGHFNAIWQGDANAWSLRALAHTGSPPIILNVTGPGMVSVRAVAEEFGQRMGRAAKFIGTESGNALLSNAGRAEALFGKTRVNVEQMIGWIAEWTKRGGARLGKPTHFETRDGRF